MCTPLTTLYLFSKSVEVRDVYADLISVNAVGKGTV